MALALTIGPHPDVTGAALDDATLERAWTAYGAALIEQAPAGSMPWGFWRFDPAVPKLLRAGRPQLYAADDELVRGQHHDLEQRRAAWLAEHYDGASPQESTP